MASRSLSLIYAFSGNKSRFFLFGIGIVNGGYYFVSASLTLDYLWLEMSSFSFFLLRAGDWTSSRYWSAANVGASSFVDIYLRFSFCFVRIPLITMGVLGPESLDSSLAFLFIFNWKILSGGVHISLYYLLRGLPG